MASDPGIRSHSLPHADVLGGSNELFVFEPEALTWKDIGGFGSTANYTGPLPRFGHGFASAGGKLYVMGGALPNGKPTFSAIQELHSVGIDIIEWPAAGDVLDDMWAFDPVALEWSSLPVRQV